MDRRVFLKSLGGLFVAAAAPTKTYAFFGDILRPQAELVLGPPPGCIAPQGPPCADAGEVYRRLIAGWVVHFAHASSVITGVSWRPERKA